MPFTFVSGNLSLDFAGTVMHRDTAPEDLLSSPRLLQQWVAESGLVDSPPPVGEADLAAALAVREAIYRLALAFTVDGPSTSEEPGRWPIGHTASVSGARRRQHDVDLINRAAAEAPVTPCLTRDGLRKTGDATAVTATIARDAVLLLGGPDAGRIRQCGNPPCTRLFLDTSRAGSRRWCDMAGCGNRAKVAGFRARRTPGRAAANRPPHAGMPTSE
jgi:predicted RNA-binding Zn ribbon-like protein